MSVINHEKLLQAVSLVCLVVALFSISARAQNPPASTTQTISPEKQALIRELLDLTSSKKTIDALFKAQGDQMDKELPQIIWQAVSGMKELQSLTPEQREEVRLKVLSSSFPGRRMYELLQSKLNFHKLIEDISMPLHDKYFSEGELTDLVAFYKTATGKKVIEVMPVLVAESMTRAVEAVMPKVAELMAQIQEEETQRMTKELQATVKTNEKPAKPRPRTRQRRPRH